MRKHRYCLFLRKTSFSPFLKDVAQTKSMSLLFPSYELIWEPPKKCHELLLLDTIINPLNLKEDYSWVLSIPIVLGLPETSKKWKRVLGREIQEVDV